ncbi:hypothetical protein [Micromonospora echinofusca]|uniref:Uncharacterized protein n=1 Tax=Micromonospora echinofusca TaxID=47858 RepID=A0ABS3VLJ1_MICEH|nr:hypothetical protein [Micromonospora echinofusca]MBO4205249.1 hypothetical protein [Micromonospora echinofusca]
MARPSAAEWLQAFGAVASLLISVVAVVVALSGQHAQNQREKSRYATRVSAWFDDVAAEGPSLTIVMQNRSPVPVHLLALYVDYLDGGDRDDIARYSWDAWHELPPCSTVRIDAPFDGPRPHSYLRFVFRENATTWLNDNLGVHEVDGLRLVPDLPFDGRERTQPSRVVDVREASDCGVDG